MKYDAAEVEAFSSFAVIPPNQTLWQWADEHVVFSESYPTARRGRYKSAFVPFWREPMECLTDRNIREVVVLAAAQSGKTEQMLLMPIRFNVLRNPGPTLYVGASQSQVEAVWEERIKVALRDMRETRRLLAQARIKEHEVYFPNGAMLAITWATSVAGLKSRPIHTVLLDEVSVFEEDAIAKVRMRTLTFPFSKIVVCSTPDSKQSATRDPILVEFANTDRREYFVPDPATGNLFRFEMGAQDSRTEKAWGLKWDQSARRDDGWDIDAVRKSAHYRTPDGTVITDREKRDLLSAGKWIPTNSAAPSDRRGYHINAFLLPWVSFGDIAAAFLQAKESGKSQLRVFVHEWLAEPWHAEREAVYADRIAARQGPYARGQRISQVDPWRMSCAGKDTAVFVTMDVQQREIYWLAREWISGGESGLLAWGTAQDWAQVAALLERYQPYAALIDIGYAERRLEVLEHAAALDLIPTRGESRPMLVPYQKRELNIYEGTPRQREGIRLYSLVFSPDYFKDLLADRVNGTGPGWHVYTGIEVDYQRQMTSEEKVAGRWQCKRGRSANHLWDCEVLQMLAAVVSGYASAAAAMPEVPAIQPDKS